MNYKGFKEIPFPSKVNQGEEEIKDFFFSLTNEEQLTVLKESSFYAMFLDHVSRYMETDQNLNFDARILSK